MIFVTFVFGPSKSRQCLPSKKGSFWTSLFSVKLEHSALVTTGVRFDYVSQLGYVVNKIQYE